MMQEDEVPDAEEEEQQVKQKRAMALLPCTVEAERKWANAKALEEARDQSLTRIAKVTRQGSTFVGRNPAAAETLFSIYRYTTFNKLLLLELEIRLADGAPCKCPFCNPLATAANADCFNQNYLIFCDFNRNIYQLTICHFLLGI